MTIGVWLVNIMLLGMPSSSSPSADSEPRLLYRTTDRMTPALAYDVEADAAVELVQLGPYGPSVLRRLSSNGEPREVMWKTEREALCPEGYCGGVGLEYSEKLAGYVVRVAVGTSHRVPSVYVAQSGGRVRLVARTFIQPRGADSQDTLEPGVIGIGGLVESVLTADGTGEILVSTEGSGEKFPARTYLIDAIRGKLIDQLEGKIVGKGDQGFFVSRGTKSWRRLETEGTADPEHVALTRRPLVPVDDSAVTKVVESRNRRAEWRAISGEIRIRRMNEHGTQATTAVEAGTWPLRLKGCGSEADRPIVTGVWATKRGTFVVAVDQYLKVEQGQHPVFGGTAHCLYEVE